MNYSKGCKPPITPPYSPPPRPQRSSSTRPALPPEPELPLVLLECHPLQFRIDLPRLGIGPERPAEEEDVRLGAMDGVVVPPPALLHAYGAPLVLGEEARLRQRLRQFLGEDDVPVRSIVLFHVEFFFSAMQLMDYHENKNYATFFVGGGGVRKNYISE